MMMESNDPLCLKAYEGEEEMSLLIAEIEFEADAVGYIELVEEEYRAISAVDRHYAMCVPASAHAYYHHVLYWYKLALLSQIHGTYTEAQDQLVEFVQGYPSAVAGAGAAAHLAGLGDYEGATGIKHVLTARQPNQNGHFGRATAETHGLYERLPAPSISLQRTLEDVAKSTERGYDEQWIIDEISPAIVANAPPEEINAVAAAGEGRRNARVDFEFRDAEQDNHDLAANDQMDNNTEDEEDEGPQRPTVNLLGWRPARSLTANQLAEMRDVYDDGQRNVGDLSRMNNTYSLFRPLFEFIIRRIRECKRYNTAIIPTNTTGSLAQQTVWSPSTSVASATQSFVSQEGQLKSFTMIAPWLASAAKVICYRAIRQEFEEEAIITNPWSCFHYRNYREVPQNWRNNRKTLTQHRRDDVISYAGAPYESDVSPRQDALKEYLYKHKSP